MDSGAGNMGNIGLAFSGSVDYAALLNEPAALGKFAKLLDMKNLQISHFAKRPVLLNELAVAQ